MHEARLPSRTLATQPGYSVSISRPPVDEFTGRLEFRIERSENVIIGDPKTTSYFVRSTRIFLAILRKSSNQD